VLALLPVVGAAAVETRDVTRKSGRPADRQVMFVGNNWAGTATVVDVRTHKPIKTLNIVPDREQAAAAWLAAAIDAITP